MAVVLACATAAAETTWQPRVSAGFDTYVHTYHLAYDDTTESVSESVITAEIEGRSARRSTHRWRLRAMASGGSELFRQLLDGTYRWRPGGTQRLRCDVDWLGRQYRGDTDYALASDNHEGRAELRAYPWTGESAGLDVRWRGRFMDYRTPSSLQQDYREHGGGAFLTSQGLGLTAWRMGGRITSRAYPDSSAIDRDVLAVEGDLDLTRGDGHLWFYHRTERRLTEHEEVRPSAWSHWSELQGAWPAGRGRVVTNVGSEVWRYDRQDVVWFNAWRLDSELGYGWGDPLAARWQTLLTVERLGATEAAESYSQVGLRGSVESFSGAVTGLLELEYGHRWYDDTAEATGVDDIVLTYTDFSYLEIWLMATWSWSPHLSLELTASYQPEQHTEQDDNTALGYGSVQLVWRP